MQYYQDGFDFAHRRWTYRSSHLNNDDAKAQQLLPKDVDVLIVGTGPAGLLLATQLARFPGIETAVIEARPEELKTGQADGLQCRSIETFEALGFSERVLREAYWVNEVTFWRPDEVKGIVRGDRNIDTEEGLSEFPHVILNQARLHDFFLDEMFKYGLQPYYGVSLKHINRTDDDKTLRVSVGGFDAEPAQDITARYVVGCDGARSGVRKALGLQLKGDSAHAAWGVADVLVDSDFPDLRFKCIIRSKDAGTLQIIPREGGYLIRIYVEMEKLGVDERVAQRGLGYEDIITAAKRIFQPYKFEVKECAWWSIYEIGQRLTDRFDNGSETQQPNVFICGDACHTHSPKAGQGMNVSMQDALNLGWKLVQVLSCDADPALLSTYSDERQACAKDLINFDHELAYVFSGKNDVEPAYFENFFKKAGRYMAGVAIQYEPSLIIAADGECRQELATGFPIGKRFHSEEVLRINDARRIHLGHTMPADARWRLLIFTGDDFGPSSEAMQLCQWLQQDTASPVVRFTPPRADVDSLIDVKAVFSSLHTAVDLNSLPSILWPAKGKHGLRDYEKIFCDRGTTAKIPMPSIYATRGISRRAGCMVVVRPDQHVSAVFPLDAQDDVGRFFERIMRC